MNKWIKHEINISKQVLKFKQLYLNIWCDIKTDFPNLQGETGYWHKRNKEKETDEFLKQFFKAIEKFPAEEMERKDWKQKVQLMLDDFIKNSDLISERDKEVLLQDDLIKVTKNFINEVKNFNPNINPEDIGQAIRNVWIMNLIQMLLHQKLQLTPSIFGYSMLYPYTDNYLDNPEIRIEDKLKITDVFEKRLAGDNLKPSDDYEDNLFKLVDKIEEQYDRNIYCEVFESLLCIHHAQGKSLKQQGQLSGPYEKDILGISIEKGGISVLADAYLVNGTLTEKEATFFFGYGVLLQICDDLQDGKEDLQDKHMTIISQLYKKWKLDNITSKLINFTYDLIDDMDFFKGENINELKDVIRKNCILLILFAVASNKKMYSRKYLKQIQKYFPFRTKYMTHLYKKLKKRYSNIKQSYNGVKTDQIILFALGSSDIINPNVS
ncbi:hypothetical protein [Clostridium akagii]|uniref:hypothetical protein n=1 Tax=Clostridium akagii TaxID=91623 RepID=UPI00068E218A|nr:hypothetical protein [Clostridium akagii]